MRAECASPWWEQLAVEPASVSFLAVIYRESVRWHEVRGAGGRCVFTAVGARCRHLLPFFLGAVAMAPGTS